MADLPMQEVMISILQILRQQTNYLHRQHGWLIAVAETVEKHPEFEQSLRQHPFFYQGPREDAQITQSLLQSIDGLIALLQSRVQ